MVRIRRRPEAWVTAVAVIAAAIPGSAVRALGPAGPAAHTSAAEQIVGGLWVAYRETQHAVEASDPEGIHQGEAAIDEGLRELEELRGLLPGSRQARTRELLDQGFVIVGALHELADTERASALAPLVRRLETLIAEIQTMFRELGSAGVEV